MTVYVDMNSQIPGQEHGILTTDPKDKTLVAKKAKSILSLEMKRNKQKKRQQERDG